MSRNRQDEFKDSTKLAVARQAGNRCSYPRCPVPTSGPSDDGATWVTLGEAAHIREGQVDHLKQLIPACIRSGDVDLLLASVDSAAVALPNSFSGFSACEFIEASTPIPGQSNLYSTTSMDASELRSELLRRCYADSPKIRNVSVRFLRDIDEHRQAHGAPLSEPRHPRLGSSLSWPILEKEI